MTHGPRRGVLVLEGAGSDLQTVGVQREALQGALIHLSVFRGLAVLRARDPGETAKLIVYLGRQAQAWAHGPLPRPGYRPKGRRARQLFLLQGLPRVGPSRAARLLDRFGSVQAVATASAADLATIDGIGDATAARIRWALGAEEGADSNAKPELKSQSAVRAMCLRQQKHLQTEPFLPVQANESSNPNCQRRRPSLSYLVR
jgi:ERCC4-type nuclease